MTAEWMHSSYSWRVKVFFIYYESQFT